MLHEFGTVKGVKEDVTDIVLNLKQLIIKMHCDDPRYLTIDVNKKGEVTAADINEIAEIEVLNKDLVIATCTEKAKLKMEILIGHGRGYVPAEVHKLDDYEIGLIPVDSNFSPVVPVNYEVKKIDSDYFIEA